MKCHIFVIKITQRLVAAGAAASKMLWKCQFWTKQHVPTPCLQLKS